MSSSVYGRGDQLVELELAAAGRARASTGCRALGLGRAEQRALDPLLVERQLEQADRDADVVGDVAEAGDDDGARLADGRERLRRRARLWCTPTVTIAESAPWPLVNAAGELGGLLHRRDGVGGAELQRRLALELDRVDGDDVGRAGVRRALHGVDADAADAHDDDRVAGLDLGRVDRRAPAGADAAADEAGDLERESSGRPSPRSPRRRRW